MKKLLIFAIIIPVLIAVLGIGGYFAYNEMQGQHAKNLQDLEKFGFTVLPSNTHSESKGVLGEKQLPATFAQEKLTPTQKVIQGLMDDNDQLIEEQQQLKDQIEKLKAEVAALENYKKLNEHFAPLTIAEEITAV
jgi:peptidoglycan hydrolase CwlO-like protein